MIVADERPTVAPGRPPRRRALLGVAAGALAGYAAFLMWVASRPSLWGDEGFTAAMVRLPVGRILADLRHIDVNMGAYYLLVVPVERVAGSSELALRLVSVLAVTATIPLFARLVAPVSGRLPATLAAVALALNPFVVTVAATARPYAVLLLGTVGTAIALRRALYRSRDARDSAGDWLLWAGLCSVLLYVHLLAVLVIGAQVLVAAGCRPRLGRHLLPAAVLVAASAVPTALFIAPGNTLSWVGPASVASAKTALFSAFGGRSVAVVVGAVAAVGVVVLVRRAAMDAPGRVERRVLAGLGIVPVAGIVAIAPVQSLFVDLYLTPLLVPVFGLVAAGISGVSLARLRALARRLRGSASRPLPHTLVATVVAAGLAVVVVVGLEARTTALQLSLESLAQPQQWRQASALLDGQVTAGDVIAFPNVFYRIVAEYYADRSHGAAPSVAAQGPGAGSGNGSGTGSDEGSGPAAGWRVGTPVLPSAAWGTRRPYELDRDKRLGLYDDEATLLAEVKDARTVWLVGPQDPLVLRARDRLVAHGWTLVQLDTLPGVALLKLTHPA